MNGTASATVRGGRRSDILPAVAQAQPWTVTEKLSAQPSDTTDDQLAGRGTTVQHGEPWA